MEGGGVCARPHRPPPTFSPLQESHVISFLRTPPKQPSRFPWQCLSSGHNEIRAVDQPEQVGGIRQPEHRPGKASIVDGERRGRWSGVGWGGAIYFSINKSGTSEPLV